MALVGEAEIIATVNTAGAEAKLVGLEDSANAGIGTKAETAGRDAGGRFTSGLSAGTKDVGKDTEESLSKSTGRMQGLVKDSTGKMSGFLSNLGVPSSLLTGYGALAVGVGAIAAGALDLGSKMQSADAAIATSAGISVKAATDIGNAFLNTKNEFSGIQQAKAFSDVAGQLKLTEGAALTTAQSLTFMNAATTLATAKGISLGTATSTTAGVLQAFQLKVKDAADVTNVLFNASNATGQGVDALGASFEKTRSKLGAMSPPLKDLAALMLDMTKNGVTGRAAMTGLNTAMTALQGAATGSTKANLLAKQTLDQYGVSVTNAKGQLTPMSDIIDKLGPKFATMTQQQQLATAATIFGASAAKQMTAVIDGGVASYKASADAITKHNAVQDAANLKAHTLAGTFDTLKATVLNLGTQLGQELMPILTEVMNLVSDLVPIIGGTLKAAFDIIGPVISGVVTSIQLLVKVLTDLGHFVKDVFTGDWSAAWTDIKKTADDLVAWFENPIKTIVTLFTGLPTQIKSAFETIVDAIESPFITAFNFVVRIYNDTIGRIPGWLGGPGKIDLKLSPTFASTLQTRAAQATTDTAYNAKYGAMYHGAGEATTGAKATGTPKPTGSDQYQTSPTTAGGASGASTKLDPAELAIQARGTAMMAADVAAVHSKSLTELDRELDATHDKRMKALADELNATHNTKLEAMATKLEADFKGLETAKNALLVSDQKTGTTALSAQLALGQSTSLASLSTALDAIHTTALNKIETNLTATHKSALVSLSQQLVAAHTAVLENWEAQTLAAQAAANLKTAQAGAGVTGLQETVNEDQVAMIGLSGDALKVAQDQLAIDQAKLTEAQQAATLQAAVDSATSASAKATAQAALDSQNAQATINDANLAAALSWQNTLKGIDDAVTQAQAAVTADQAAVASATDATSAATAQAQLATDQATLTAAQAKQTAAQAGGPATTSAPSASLTATVSAGVTTGVAPLTAATTALTAALTTGAGSATSPVTVAPTPAPTTITLNIAPGAVVIHAAPGAATDAMEKAIEKAFSELGQDLSKQLNGLGPVVAPA